MKFVIKNLPQENIYNLMKRIGYHFQTKNKEKEELIFVQPLAPSGYPRFHLYLKRDEKQREIIFNIHLDQKKAIYKGTPAHSAESQNQLIQKEAERIKKFFS